MADPSLTGRLAELARDRRAALRRLLAVLTIHLGVGIAIVTWALLQGDGPDVPLLPLGGAFAAYIALWVGLFEYSRRTIAPRRRPIRAICRCCGTTVSGAMLRAITAADG